MDTGDHMVLSRGMLMEPSPNGKGEVVAHGERI